MMARYAKLFILSMLLVVFSAAHWAVALDKDTLDLLLKKGVITQKEYDEIIKNVQGPPPAPPVREPLKDTTPTTSTETGPGPHPVGSYRDLERVPGGIENLRKQGYRNVFTSIDNVLKHSERLSVGIVALKVQYVADNVDRKPGTAVDPATGFAGTIPTRDENGFRIRAAEFYVTGRLTPWSTYYVELDFARQSEIVLNSMYLDFYTKDMAYVSGMSPYVKQLRLGQFRQPFGIEQGTSQGLIDFVNRAYYTDLALGSGPGVDTRAGDPGLNPFGKSNSTGFVQQLDMGAMLVGGFRQLPLEPEYEVAIINGAGRNFNDNNADKDVTGRLIFTPVQGMKFYLASYYGTSFFNGTAAGPLRNNTDVKKFREGAMFTYIPPFFNNLVKLQAEYIDGYDNGFRRRTWYGYVLFRPIPALPNFEPEYRYEQFTVDTNRDNSMLDRHTVGFNYYFHTNVKLTVNYEIKHDQNEGNPFITTGGGVANANNKNFFVTQIQFRY